MPDTTRARQTLLKSSSRVNEIIQVLPKYGFASWLQAVPAEHRSFISNFAKSGRTYLIGFDDPPVIDVGITEYQTSAGIRVPQERVLVCWHGERTPSRCR